MISVMIVEDEIPVRMLTKAKLKDKYTILEAENGLKALELLDHHHIDLIIVDIMMPEMNGYEFVDILRKNNDTTPIIMLTALNSFAHKKKGFATGIDDYMTKPIDYEELKWRIKALLRRSQIVNEKKISVGSLTLNADSYSANLNGKDIELTKKEFDLLYKFLSYPNVIFTKQQIMDEIWGYDTETTYDTIKTYINRLRNKFTECKDFEFISVRGLGYKVVIAEETENEKE